VRYRTVVPPIGRLADLVKDSGMTQARVAELAEMTPGNLSRLLAGHKPNPGIATVARVLDAIGKRWADLDR
jgi:transcriptional regulator with XRE-family HTH domain